MSSFFEKFEEVLQFLQKSATKGKHVPPVLPGYGPEDYLGEGKLVVRLRKIHAHSLLDSRYPPLKNFKNRKFYPLPLIRKVFHPP